MQNLYYTTRQAYGKQFNYRYCWQHIKQYGFIVAATAYAVDRQNPKQQQFQNTLRKLGFNVKLKPYIQRSDGSAKGDWDVGIAIDVLDASREVDTIVLLSGDGDFDILLKKVSDDMNVKTIAYGVPQLTAQSLINNATLYNPITDAFLL